MPPELWSGEPIDVMQRHSRYVQASKYIDELNAELTAARAEIAELNEEYGTWWAQKSIALDELKAVTEQRDGLRSGIDYASDQLHKVTEQRDRLIEALREIKNELGVPQPEYPAPVANAVKIANKALAAVEGDKV